MSPKENTEIKLSPLGVAALKDAIAIGDSMTETAESLSVISTLTKVGITICSMDGLIEVLTIYGPFQGDSDKATTFAKLLQEENLIEGFDSSKQGTNFPEAGWTW